MFKGGIVQYTQILEIIDEKLLKVASDTQSRPNIEVYVWVYSLWMLMECDQSCLLIEELDPSSLKNCVVRLWQIAIKAPHA